MMIKWVIVYIALSEYPLCDSLEDYTWLFRGVPHESEERLDVLSIEEVHPPRPDRIGPEWRWKHQNGHTVTGYTSWTTDRETAICAAKGKSEEQGLSERIVVFRVRIAALQPDQVFEGREGEAEFLLQGTVEEVSISEDASDDEETELD
jgi:hypothetical protein